MLTVYRLQNVRGHGPYATEDVVPSHLRKCRHPHPSPKLDFGPAVRDLLYSEDSDNFLFGFPTLEAAFRWLSVRGQCGLTLGDYVLTHNPDFKLYQVQVDGLLLCSDKQCVYDVRNVTSERALV